MKDLPVDKAADSSATNKTQVSVSGMTKQSIYERKESCVSKSMSTSSFTTLSSVSKLKVVPTAVLFATPITATQHKPTTSNQENTSPTQKKDNITPTPKLKSISNTPRQEKTFTPKLAISSTMPKQEMTFPTPNQESISPTQKQNSPSLKLESTSSKPKLDSSSPTLNLESTLNTPKQESTSLLPKLESTLNTPKQESTSLLPKLESTLNTPKLESTTPTPKQESTSFTSKQKSISTAKESILSPTPKQEQTSPTPKLESISPSPEQESTSLTPIRGSVSAAPKQKNCSIYYTGASCENLREIGALLKSFCGSRHAGYLPRFDFLVSSNDYKWGCFSTYALTKDLWFYNREKPRPAYVHLYDKEMRALIDNHPTVKDVFFGGSGKSCKQVCNELNRRCDQSRFPQINSIYLFYRNSVRCMVDTSPKGHSFWRFGEAYPFYRQGSLCFGFIGVEQISCNRETLFSQTHALCLCSEP